MEVDQVAQREDRGTEEGKVEEPHLPIPWPARPQGALVALAALSLFTELALIRWAGAHFVYLAYFANFILLACFLGIGLGFLSTRRRWDLLPRAPVVLVGVLLMVHVLRPEISLDVGGIAGRVYFNTGQINSTSWIPLPLALAALFSGTVATFACVAQAMGRCFTRFAPLKAYSLDILGSLLGIVLFTALSLLWAPAWSWFALVGVGFVALLWHRLAAQKVSRAVVVLACAGLPLVAALADESLDVEETIWSPYQLITVSSMDLVEELQVIRANLVPHQGMWPVRNTEHVRYTPYSFAGQEGLGPIEKVLIIGAGSGNDVSTALLHPEVERVVAVEIDPVIAEIGIRRHPSRPYDDPRVELRVGDGRNVLEQDDGERFDMVIFALPDSLGLLSGYSSVRLESFLFTQESLRTAFRRLRPGGLLVLYNDYRTGEVVDKLASMMKGIVGKNPWTMSRKDMRFSMLIASEAYDGPVLERPVAPERLPQDDWPFLYMAERTIPPIYIGLIVGILLASLLGIWAVGGRGALGRARWPFFFMGAAFLLLETKSLVQFSLLFGATWLVNSLVFAGVLVMVLAANLLVWKVRPRLAWPWYVLLAVALAVGWAVDPAQLMALDSPALRWIAAVALIFSPIFIANVIFSQAFAESEEGDQAFGWNLLGTMAGGALENLSLLLGYRSLALIVALLYGLALLAYLIRRHFPRRGEQR